MSENQFKKSQSRVASPFLPQLKGRGVTQALREAHTICQGATPFCSTSTHTFKHEPGFDTTVGSLMDPSISKLV